LFTPVNRGKQTDLYWCYCSVRVWRWERGTGFRTSTRRAFEHVAPLSIATLHH